MNELVIKQEIENSVKRNLNQIIRRQTDDDALYSISVQGIARNLSGPLVSIVMSLTANLITPPIQEYISSLKQVEEEECIEISHDEALKIMIEAIEFAPKNELTSSQLTDLFDVEYEKVYGK